MTIDALSYSSSSSSYMSPVDYSALSNTKTANSTDSSSTSSANTLMTSSLSLGDTDGDGITSISDLISNLNDLYAKQEANTKSGVTDKELDSQIESTQKLVSDFKTWAKQQCEGSGDSDSISEGLSSMLSNMNKTIKDSGLFVDLDV